MQILMSSKFARRATSTMFFAALVLILASFAAQLSVNPLAQLLSTRSSLDMPASREIARHALGILNADYELNIPTWFSASVLLLNSVLLAAIALAKKEAGDRYVVHWWGLSAVFLLLSIDEIAGFHDRVNGLLSPLLGTSGIFTYFWVIPWSAFVVLFLLVYSRFFLALPTRVKWLFLGAGSLYVGGALGGEMVLGYMVSEQDVLLDRWWRLEVMIEEFLEMTGTILFFYALTGYCGDPPTMKANTQLPPGDQSGTRAVEGPVQE